MLHYKGIKLDAKTNKDDLYEVFMAGLPILGVVSKSQDVALLQALMSIDSVLDQSRRKPMRGDLVEIKGETKIIDHVGLDRLSVYSLNSELESYPLVTDNVVSWWTEVIVGHGETIPMPKLGWSHVGVLEFTSYEDVEMRRGAFKYSKDVMVWTVV